MTSTNEHRSEAEKYLNKARIAERNAASIDRDYAYRRLELLDEADRQLRFAQVHATLGVSK